MAQRGWCRQGSHKPTGNNCTKNMYVWDSYLVGIIISKQGRFPTSVALVVQSCRSSAITLYVPLPRNRG
jgi:hypothetical protein